MRGQEGTDTDMFWASQAFERTLAFTLKSEELLQGSEAEDQHTLNYI